MLERRATERRSESESSLAPGTVMCSLLDSYVAGRVAHVDRGYEESDARDHGGADPDHAARGVVRSERAARERGDGDAEIARRLVETEREAAAGGAGEGGLHDDPHRPGQALGDPEQEVGRGGRGRRGRSS